MTAAGEAGIEPTDAELAETDLQEPATDTVALRESLSNFIGRLELVDVRVRRMHADALVDPPFEFVSIHLTLDDPQVRFESDRFDCQFVQHAVLNDVDDQLVASVEVALVLTFKLADGEQPTPEVVGLFIDRNAYFMAYPYLRQAVQEATTRVGVEPVLLGILKRDDVTPVEIHTPRVKAAPEH